MNYLHLLMLFETIFVIGSFYALKKDILAPSFLAGCSFWLSALCVLLNESKWNVHLLKKTLLILVFGQIAMFLGDILATKVPVLRKKDKETIEKEKSMEYKPIFIQKGKNLFLFTFNTALFVYFAYSILKKGFYMNAIIDAHRMQVEDGISEMNVFVQQSFRFLIVCALVYAFILLYNRIICNKKYQHDMFYSLYFNALAIIESVLSASRRNIIVMLIAWFFMTVVLWNVKNGWQFKLSKKLIRKTGVIVAITMVIFRALHTILKGTQSNLTSFYDYVTYYIGCPIQSLNIYLQRNVQIHRSPYWGQFSLPSLMKALKRIPRSVETTFDYVYLGGGANAASNVYTFFLAPYLDFGFMGCMIFSFVVYFVLSLLYTKAVKNRNMTYSVARNTAILGFIYWITLNSFYFCPVMFVFAPTGLISVICFWILFVFLFRIRFN